MVKIMIENFKNSSEYVQNLFKIENEVIKIVEKESLDDNVPIITREVLNYMIFEAKRIKAKYTRNWDCYWIFRFFFRKHSK